MTLPVKLTEAPAWCIQYPTCGACEIDLTNEAGDGWTCDNCGTAWGSDANDGDAGELYESWSGVQLEGEPVTHEEAAQVASDRAEAERAKWWAEFRARQAVGPS